MGCVSRFTTYIKTVHSSTEEHAVWGREVGSSNLSAPNVKIPVYGGSLAVFHKGTPFLLDQKEKGLEVLSAKPSNPERHSSLYRRWATVRADLK